MHYKDVFLMFSVCALTWQHLNCWLDTEKSQKRLKTKLNHAKFIENITSTFQGKHKIFNFFFYKINLNVEIIMSNI